MKRILWSNEAVMASCRWSLTEVERVQLETSACLRAGRRCRVCCGSVVITELDVNNFVAGRLFGDSEMTLRFF